MKPTFYTDGFEGAKQRSLQRARMIDAGQPLAPERAFGFENEESRDAFMAELKVPSFANEAEEADWWFKNRDGVTQAFEKAAENGTLSRGTTARLAKVFTTAFDAIDKVEAEPDNSKASAILQTAIEDIEGLRLEVRPEDKCEAWGCDEPQVAPYTCAEHLKYVCAQSKAPEGWCTRTLDHDGPCAAIQYQKD